MRKLATLRKVAEIIEIPGADAIEAVRVDGWICVAKKNEFNIGDICLYIEIDSWVPTEIAPFLSKGKEPREFNGIKGERLRTMKLRGTLSQGLLLPLSQFPNITVDKNCEDLGLTETLGIQLWEKAENCNLRGISRGNFPYYLRKTDQERVQNLSKVFERYKDETFEVTVKLDGSSCTMYFLAPGSTYIPEQTKDGEINLEFFEGRLGVCSKNIDLKETDDNVFWNTARKIKIEEKLNTLLGGSYAVQGELIAPSIQNNHEKVKEPEFHVFSVFDIDKQCYLLPEERRNFCKDIGFSHVPLLENSITLDRFTSMNDILEYAEGPSMNYGVHREGVVFKHTTSDFSFKVISNSYLLKEKD